MFCDGTTFLAQFNASREESIARSIDASPVASAIKELFDHNGGMTAPAKEIMKQASEYKPDRCDSWPRTPKGFADAMRRVAPALRQYDIECHSLPKTGGVINWTIKPREKFLEPYPERPAHPFEQDVRTSRTSPTQLSASN